MPTLIQRPEKQYGREPDQFISTSGTDAQAVAELNALFSTAAANEVSDVHFEHTEDACTVRFRHDGDLAAVREYKVHQAKEFDKQLRMKCSLSLVERVLPLDGNFRFKTEGRFIEVRVSILPTGSGESIVCRLLDQAANLRTIDQLDMPTGVRTEVERAITRHQGLLIVSGPTGSGKTTTLYSLIQRLNQPKIKIITVEDPIEYRIDGIVQAQTSERLTFATALRSILRQDPDVILVGEIRDGDTARIAVQAALTGHIVLTTIHANSATEILTRMLNLGVDPNALAAAMGGMLAQRLIRTLCSHCRHPVPLDEGARQSLLANGVPAEALAGVDTIYDPSDAGCEHCVRGWSGRMPIYEFVVPTRTARRAIEEESLGKLKDEAQQQPHYVPLAQSAFLAVARGRTSLSEAILLASA